MNKYLRMYGLFQTAFYFGYMAMFSLALGLVCGTIGTTCIKITSGQTFPSTLL